MKPYRVLLPEELADAVERYAQIEDRAPAELIRLIVERWAFGALRPADRATAADAAALRSERRPTRIPLTAKQRNQLFERCEGKCAYCTGQLLYDEPWHIDHIKPVSKGGTNDPVNLTLSCPRCNLKKAAK